MIIEIFSQNNGIIVTEKSHCNDGFERSHDAMKSKLQCDYEWNFLFILLRWAIEGKSKTFLRLSIPREEEGLAPIALDNIWSLLVKLHFIHFILRRQKSSYDE